MIVAAVDLGTNTTRLLVSEVEEGRVEELHRETRITRLGEGVDARRRLLPVPIARVRNTLSDYRRTAESLGAERTLLVATSAVRDAGWSSQVARRAHNPEVAGSNPAPATRKAPETGSFCFRC